MSNVSPAVLEMNVREAVAKATLGERQRASQIHRAGVAAHRTKLAAMHIEAGTPVEEAVIAIGPPNPLLAGSEIEEFSPSLATPSSLPPPRDYEVGSSKFC